MIRYQDDFYKAVNGKWAETAVIPDDKPRTGGFSDLADEIEELIGKDSLNHFGEYEDDSVFVRNDRLRTDYEILADSRPYGEVE